MKLVIIESPYAGDIEGNTEYARRCMRHSVVELYEAPIASHLLYTQPGILDENLPHERSAGIAAGLSWSRVADVHAFYTDLGWSRGMKAALTFCKKNGQMFEFRALDGPIQEPE